MCNRFVRNYWFQIQVSITTSPTLAAPHVPDALLLTILTRGPHFHTHNALPILLSYIPIQTQYPHFDVLLHSLHTFND